MTAGFKTTAEIPPPKRLRKPLRPDHCLLAALRVVYKQSWLATILKFFLLGFGYAALLGLCLGGTVLAALWFL